MEITPRNETISIFFLHVKTMVKTLLPPIMNKIMHSNPKQDIKNIAQIATKIPHIVKNLPNIVKNLPKKSNETCIKMRRRERKICKTRNEISKVQKKPPKAS